MPLIESRQLLLSRYAEFLSKSSTCNNVLDVHAVPSKRDYKTSETHICGKPAVLVVSCLQILFARITSYKPTLVSMLLNSQTCTTLIQIATPTHTQAIKMFDTMLT